MLGQSGSREASWEDVALVQAHDGGGRCKKWSDLGSLLEEGQDWLAHWQESHWEQASDGWILKARLLILFVHFTLTPLSEIIWGYYNKGHVFSKTEKT